MISGKSNKKLFENDKNKISKSFLDLLINERSHLKMFTLLDMYYTNSTHEITSYLQQGQHLIVLMSKIGAQFFMGLYKFINIIDRQKPKIILTSKKT
ncbi:hypothetical protein D4R71_00150 [bacterium]|nr:MAG: hypothetical protein D4R71_00150 [bacterium]